jgi:hypothetical protein
MGSLMGRDLLEAATGEVREARLGEVGGGELGECARVKRVLKVLEGERKVEDLDV